MAEFSCKYRVDLNKSNLAYIQALKSYGEKLEVIDIRDKEGKPLENLRKVWSYNVYENNLPTVLKKMETQGFQGEYTYTCKSLNSESLSAVFPPLRLESRPLHINKRPTAGWYLEGIMGEEADGTRCINPNDYNSQAKLFNRDEAISLVRASSCSGAVDLKELKTLIFEYGGTCFYLRYDTKPIYDPNPEVSCSLIGCLPRLSFDLGCGFSYVKLERATKHGSAFHEVNVVSALDEYFRTWRDLNKYQGSLFPESIGLDFEFKAESIHPNLPIMQEEKIGFKHPGSFGVFSKKGQEEVRAISGLMPQL